MPRAATDELTPLLRHYEPHKLIRENLKDKNYFWNKIKKDMGWKDGVPYYIPWMIDEGASDFEIGGLIDEDKLGSGAGIKAVESKHAFISGAMKFLQRDLKRFSTLKQSFLKVLPERVNQFTKRFSKILNQLVLAGGCLGAFKADGTAGGLVTVLKPREFTIGQRLIIVSDSQADIEGYVAQIDVNNKQLLFKNGREVTSTALDLSLYTVADNAKIMLAGYETSEAPYTLVDHIFPAALGGLDTIHGIEKMKSPLLQAQLINASSWTSSTIMSDIYDMYFDIKEQDSVEKAELLCNYNLFKTIVKAAEKSKQFSNGETKVGIGYSSVEIIGPEGNMTITAIHGLIGMNKAFIIDWDAFIFAGDELFEQVKDMDANLYTKYRKKTGFEYVTDYQLSGNLICTKASTCCGIHDIPEF